MKQKIEIKVSMKRGEKYRTKALKIAAGVSGDVVSVSLAGEDKDTVEVVGDGVDAVQLTNLLRKGFGSARLEAVTAVEEKKQNSDAGEDKPPECWTYGWGVPRPYYCQSFHGSYCTCTPTW